jgi:hypothetical protein
MHTHATHTRTTSRTRPRSIVVSLVINDSASRGLVAVRDNGVGMTPQVRGGRAAAGQLGCCGGFHPIVPP